MNRAIQLENLKPTDLPSPNQAALQILRASSRADVTSQQLSELAATDPVLTAELLRVVNSPLYGLSREVQSINHAVTVLGLRALRNLVLCLSVRDVISKEALPEFDTTVFWEDSLRRAVCAKKLAEIKGLDPDDCFTAGLLQDFGLLTLFYLQPDKSPQWLKIRQLDPEKRLEAEQTLFAITHDHMVHKLADTWGLPNNLSQALGLHHMEVFEEVGLSLILYCTDWVCSIFTSEEPSSILQQARQQLEAHLAIDSSVSEEIFNLLPEQVMVAASSLGLKIDKQADFEQVIQDANIRLAKENISYQELTWRLEKTLKERDSLQRQLNRELQLAREIQSSLLPRPMENYPLHGTNISAHELSGDFYDYFELPDGRIYFNLGDVSGKGVNAALLMAKTIGLFRCLGKRIHSPAELLQIINDELCETSIRGMFVTMVAGTFNPKTSEVIMVNAGNPPPIYWTSKNKIKAVGADAPPLGIVSNNTYSEVTFSLAGGRMYIFSDGVTEGFTPDGKELGINGLVKLLQDMDKYSAQQRLQKVCDYLCKAEKGQRDDITLLSIEA